MPTSTLTATHTAAAERLALEQLAAYLAGRRRVSARGSVVARAGHRERPRGGRANS